ncbi:MAG: hypothetical protein GY851_18775 [bacterium]|nr:hypothetical protein [bacterium]
MGVHSIRLSVTDGTGAMAWDTVALTVEQLPAPDAATGPSPADAAIDVSVDATLGWTAGSGATSHDVYFGTSDPPGGSELQGNQGGTTYDPGKLLPDTTYYWRIDEVNATGTTTGTVWSFTTEAGEPVGVPVAGAAGLVALSVLVVVVGVRRTRKRS